MRDDRTIAALRDILLSKLVSGEIQLRNASRFVEGIA